MPSIPHGGRLIEQVLDRKEMEDRLRRQAGTEAWQVSAAVASDVLLLGTGAYSPLEGFMDSDTYRSVVRRMRLLDGTVWPMPITLPVTEDRARSVKKGTEVLLTDVAGQPIGLVQVSEVFTIDREQEAELVYRTTDPQHPGVRRLLSDPPYRVAGRVWTFEKSGGGYEALCLPPRRTREAFAALGWRTVVAFQTRNPVHRAHEYIQKCAMEIVDGLLLHPLVGETKADDLPADVRLRSYRAVLDGYYPPGRVFLSLFPAYMRYAGPREAVFHALCRKNYGCTHFIVGRDHAGVGNYYGTYDAQEIFREFTPEEIGITPLMFEHTFYCTRCRQMASSKTCPHDAAAHLTLSGTRVRELLRAGIVPPEELTRPEVARVLIESLSRI